MANRLHTQEQLKQMVEKPKTEVEREWLAAYFDFCKIKGYDKDREIIITPFEGHYGFAGAVIAINGSPMRGTMLVKSNDIVEQVPTVGIGSSGHIYAMYVLHGDDSPKKLSKPEWFHHSTKSKQVALWQATRNLLIERGLLKGGQ